MSKPTREIDRRIVKTKLALRDAMLTLMASKGWDELSIQSICDQANIGRSTFYLHYQGKDDLLSESLNDLRDYLVSQPPGSGGIGFGTLGGLLDHMAEQRDVFRAVIGRRSGRGVTTRFKEMVRQLVEIELKRRAHPAGKSQWLACYLAGGIVEAMSWWVDAAKPPAIREMERRLEQLSFAALNVEFKG